MQTLVIPKGDKGFNLQFTITDSSGTAYNLTGYTVTLKMWAAGDPSTALINTACTITNAASGICTYAVAASNFATAGYYTAEVELTASGIIESTETFAIQVQESG